MCKIKFYLLSFSLTILCTLSFAEDRYFFRVLNNAERMTSSQIETIYKDSRGYLWISTKSGLNRFDGVNYRCFQSTLLPSDANYLPFDYISKIIEDYSGILWLYSASNGILAFDYRSDKFISNIDSLLQEVGLPIAPKIIRVDDQKNLFVYNKNVGVWYFNAVRNSVVNVISEPVINSEDGELIDFGVKGKYLWLLYSSGVVKRFDIVTNQFDIRNIYFKDTPQRSTIDVYLSF